MIGWPWEDDRAGDQLPALSAMLAELATAEAPRRRELLAAISDLTWKIGPNAAPAIPALIDWPLGGDRETDDSICYALSNCAPASIAPLLERLDHPAELARQRACHALRLIGKTIGDRLIPVSDALLARLQDASDAVRAEAAFALGLLGDEREATVARLVEVARTGSTSTRASALHAIGNICGKRVEEEPHREGVPFAGVADVVLAALDDADPDVRRSACHALGYLGLPVSQHLERILCILHADPSAVVQEWAASQLKGLAQRADISAAAGSLVRFLDCDRWPLFWPICETLGQIGPGARAAVPALLEALKSADERVALEAAGALWHIERRAEIIPPTLDRLFESNGEKVCDIIYLMGPAAQPLLPKLLDALARDDYWDLQWAAADAIGSVASANPETLQALKDALSHDSGIVRSAAAKALAKIGAPAVPLLIDMFVSDTDEARLEWVADALSRMGPAPLAAAPSLRAKLESGGRGLRLWAAITLARIASDAEAVPALIEALDDPDLAYTWLQACEALAALGAPAAAARERLATLASCPIEEVRQPAELALAAIDRPLS